MGNIVPQQRMNCQAVTRRKARRLVVTTILQHVAYVEGDHDTYQVELERLTCSCTAGLNGLRCSHALAVIREQAQMRGAAVMFAFKLQHATSWARLQQSKGRHAYVHARGRYVWVETTAAPHQQAARIEQRLAATRTGDVERDVEALF